MTYNQVYELMSDFTGDIIPLFADGWERFPSEPNTSRIIARLENERDFWRERRPDRVEKFQRAIDEIKERVAQ